MRPSWLGMMLGAVVLATGPGNPAPAWAAEDKGEVAALYQRAEELRKAGNLREAARVYEQLMEKAVKVYGANHVNTAIMMHNLAEVYSGMLHYTRAEPLYLRSQAIVESQLGKNHLSLAIPLNSLAVLYRATGRYAKAESLFQRSLAIRQARLGKDHPDVAASLSNLATLYVDMGQYAKAEPLHQRSLKIEETRLGKDHLDVALSLNNLAELYRATGQYTKAEPLFQRSLKIREAKQGKDHLDLAVPLNNLALLYSAMGAYARAELLYKRSLAIAEAQLGQDHPEVARSLHNLAVLYQTQGECVRALPLYERSLTIWERRLGKDHPDVANVLAGLALLYQDMGKYARALPLQQRSLAICEAKLGKDHPNTANALNNLALLYARTKEIREAARLSDRSRRVARRYLAAVLPGLSDAEKAAFFQNTNAHSDLEAALSLAQTHPEDAPLAAQSAAWLLNGKAVAQEALASSVLLTRLSSDPALGKLSQKLLAVRQQLARLSLSTAPPGQEGERLQRIDELTILEEKVGKELRQTGSSAAPPAWINLAEVRNALPRDAVLIDVARFRPFDFTARDGRSKWQAARYAAWVTAKIGPVRLIDLGAADKIDDAIRSVRQRLQNVRPGGESYAERNLRVPLQTLSDLVLNPLLPYVTTSKRWLISPDGNLWLIPWEILTLPGGKYAVEHHQISYQTSGRDQLPGVAPMVTATAPVVLADPDFDLDPSRAREEAKRLLGKSIDEEQVRSLSGTLRLGEIRRLKGTGDEARAIMPSLKGYASVAPLVYMRGEALESVFKAVRHPRVLVLSTHGFFLPDQEVPRDDKAGAGKPKPAKKWENPLLRCGLLLAGCNNAARATEGDDGVLTGLEVVGTDLRGTELVVLSACETGVGEVQNGEGVSGLRQAFQLAGAKAVVSTLWQVPDKQSARLMALFFQNLGKKMGKAEALRAAKLKIIAERREDFAAAHPFFWAAFTLTGES